MESFAFKFGDYVYAIADYDDGSRLIAIEPLANPPDKEEETEEWD